MVRIRRRAHDHRMPNIEVQPKLTTAFFAQAVISFGVSLTSMTLGIAYLPATPWIRSFLVVGLLYVVTSTFTLAKCVRDQQETSQVVQRVDQARLERFIAEHNPFQSAV